MSSSSVQSPGDQCPPLYTGCPASEGLSQGSNDVFPQAVQHQHWSTSLQMAGGQCTPSDLSPPHAASSLHLSHRPGAWATRAGSWVTLLGHLPSLLFVVIFGSVWFPRLRTSEFVEASGKGKKWSKAVLGQGRLPPRVRIQGRRVDVCVTRNPVLPQGKVFLSKHSAFPTNNLVKDDPVARGRTCESLRWCRGQDGGYLQDPVRPHASGSAIARKCGLRPDFRGPV